MSRRCPYQPGSTVLPAKSRKEYPLACESYFRFLFFLFFFFVLQIFHMNYKVRFSMGSDLDNRVTTVQFRKS